MVQQIAQIIHNFNEILEYLLIVVHFNEYNQTQSIIPTILCENKSLSKLSTSKNRLIKICQLNI